MPLDVDKVAAAAKTAEEAGAPDDHKLANIIFDAFRRSNRGALMMGGPPFTTAESDVLIDGTFNFLVVARLVRRRLGMPRLS